MSLQNPYIENPEKILTGDCAPSQMSSGNLNLVESSEIPRSGEIDEYNFNRLHPDFVVVATGSAHSVVLGNDQLIYACGRNMCGRLAT